MLCVGLTTVDVTQRVAEFPGPGLKVQSLGVEVTPGGPAANAARAVAALGHRAVLVTAVDGDLGGFARERLHPVEVHSVGEGPAVSAVVVRDRDGERTVVSRNAVDVAVSTADPALVAGADVVLVDGHLGAAAVAVAREARRVGVPVLLDGGSWKPVLDELLPLVDVAACAEGFELSEAELHARGVPLVVRTRGPRPVTWSRGGATGSQEVPVVQVRDTNGAGDVWHGALAVALALGQEVGPAVRWANEVAAVRERYDFAPFEEEFRGTPLKARLCLFGGRAPLPPDLSDANARETGPACPGVPRDRSDPVFDVLRSVIVLGAPGATARQERTTAPVLFGPPGSGRSRTERWLCEDLAERGQWWVLLGADRDRGSRPVADLLLEAAVGLVGQDGPWDFSRLLGHLVARSVRRAGGGVDSDPLPLPRSGDDLEDALGGLVRTAGLGDDARPQVRRMTTRLLRPRWTRPRGGHDWHRRIVALREFADLSARADRESGERADRVLMTAFLEDLAAVEPGGRRVDPVVVISSDIDAEPLLRAWGGALTAGTRARATFVAVGDRALVEKLGLPHDQAIPAGREDVERLSRGATAFRGPHTPLPLSGLTAAQLEAMAVEAGVPERHRERLVSSVLRLSAGHAEAGAQLVRAACLLPPAEWTPRLLLGVRAHDGSGPLRDYLLDRLLAGRTVGLDDAVTRSAARNQAEAALLMTGARQARLKGSVLATEWACTGPGGVPVMHPLLRLLLVERLAERPADAPDSWEAVFTRLAGFAKRRGDEEGELHHRFAAGDVDGVLGRLEELLTSGGGRRWLDVVEIVASCPARPGRARPGPSAPPSKPCCGRGTPPATST
ncbi:hypothetical protein K7G98_04680 [Saccharothrix sp. MB29]|nr:hypothetical protein [Saccharothrix sp. MB29]